MRNRLLNKIAGLNRRDLFRNGGALAALGALRGGSAPAAAATLDIGKNIYQSIGVRPVVNCKGTFTIISGSQTLPDVKPAMDEASRPYRNLDEPMKGVPLMVDAAAEVLTMPSVHLARGATVVGYSGGKCIRGPQCAGLALGDKSLLQAAWLNSAPHHAFGRSLKVGKEEIMGMLAAVEMWMKRDHKAEWKQWEDWLGHIATSVKRVDGVTTKVNQPTEGLSNRPPGL